MTHSYPWAAGVALLLTIHTAFAAPVDRRSAQTASRVEIKSLGLGRDLTVIAVFSTECQECRALPPFYEQIAGLPGMDGVRKTFIVFTTSGVIPTKAVFDKHKFVPHRLISYPVIGTIDLPSEPPSLTVFDATATSRGQWKGPLTPAQQQEVLAILGKQ